MQDLFLDRKIILSEYKELFKNQGYLLIEKQYGSTDLENFRSLIDSDVKYWQRYLERARPTDSGNLAHHVLIQPHWIEFLDKFEPFALFEELLSSKPIINTFGINVNKKNTGTYAHNNHVDQRFFHSDASPAMLNVLIFVNDFTADNGATWLYPRNRLEFGKNPAKNDLGIQVCGKAGDVLVWDSRLLHRAGENKTNSVRRAISIMLSPPWIKPQFDYLRAYLTGENEPNLSDRQKQYLGYWSRVPFKLEQWYSEPENRFFKSTQYERS